MTLSCIQFKRNICPNKDSFLFLTFNSFFPFLLSSVLHRFSLYHSITSYQSIVCHNHISKLLTIVHTSFWWFMSHCHIKPHFQIKHLAYHFLIPIRILHVISNTFTFTKNLLSTDILLLISPVQVLFHVTVFPKYLNEFTWSTVFPSKDVSTLSLIHI